jgi:hypothetical protein
VGKLLKITSVILIQFIPTLFLFALRRIAPDFLLFESIILAIIIQLFLLGAILKVAKINLFFKKIFVSPLMVFLLSALVSFNLLFFSLMMIDRSKSLYIVNWVGSLQPVTKKALYEKIGVPEKSSEREYIEIRISEQKLRRVLSEQNGYLQLTMYGTLIQKTSNIFAEIFLLNGWTSQNLNKRP